MFNKVRLEALCDGIFAIVLTLLIIEIKVPEVHGDHITNSQLWHELGKLSPLIISYIISFTVITTYWFAHHAIMHFFVKSVDRVLLYLNMLFMMFIAFIPFSAHLFGSFRSNQPASIVYGLTIIFQGLTLLAINAYVSSNPRLHSDTVNLKDIRLSRMRVIIPIVFSFLGIIFSYWNTTLSAVLFFSPFIFNLIPGWLYKIEKLFNFEF